MTAAHFEDHPTDPDKVILRKPTMMWEGSLHIVCECDKCKAQSEQEPVALEAVYETIIHWDESGGKRSRRELARRIVSLYTTTPQRTWVGLTDEERSGKRVLGNGLLFNTAEAQVWELAVDFAEQKLKERNT